MTSKVKKLFIILSIFGFIFSIINPVLAHPGNTDKYGCHTCRTNCSKWGLSQGEYHCHRSKGLIQPSEPIKSHKVDSGAGYTTPAPEYKIPKTNNNTNTTSDVKPSLWSRFLSIFGIR